MQLQKLAVASTIYVFLYLMSVDFRNDDMNLSNYFYSFAGLTGVREFLLKKILCPRNSWKFTNINNFVP